jgi:hypothetical protein
LTRRFRSPIGAIVVHKENVNRAGATLLQERTNRIANNVGLVASGNDYRDRAGNRRQRRLSRAQALHHPKAAVRQNEIDPYEYANASGD